MTDEQKYFRVFAGDMFRLHIPVALTTQMFKESPNKNWRLSTRSARPDTPMRISRTGKYKIMTDNFETLYLEILDPSKHYQQCDESEKVTSGTLTKMMTRGKWTPIRNHRDGSTSEGVTKTYYNGEKFNTRAKGKYIAHQKIGNATMTLELGEVLAEEKKRPRFEWTNDNQLVDREDSVYRYAYTDDDRDHVTETIILIHFAAEDELTVDGDHRDLVAQRFNEAASHGVDDWSAVGRAVYDELTMPESVFEWQHETCPDSKEESEQWTDMRTGKQWCGYYESTNTTWVMGDDFTGDHRALIELRFDEAVARDPNCSLEDVVEVLCSELDLVVEELAKEKKKPRVIDDCKVVGISLVKRENLVDPNCVMEKPHGPHGDGCECVDKFDDHNNYQEKILKRMRAKFGNTRMFYHGSRHPEWRHAEVAIEYEVDIEQAACAKAFEYKRLEEQCICLGNGAKDATHYVRCPAYPNNFK